MYTPCEGTPMIGGSKPTRRAEEDDPDDEVRTERSAATTAVAPDAKAVVRAEEEVEESGEHGDRAAMRG